MVLDLRLIKVDCRETINFFCTYSNLCHTTLFSAIAHVAYVKFYHPAHSSPFHPTAMCRCSTRA